MNIEVEKLEYTEQREQSKQRVRWITNFKVWSVLWAICIKIMHNNKYNVYGSKGGLWSWVSSYGQGHRKPDRPN